MYTLDFWGFPCSQVHNLLIGNQPDPKDNVFAKINDFLTQIFPAASLITHTEDLKKSNGGTDIF